MAMMEHESVTAMGNEVPLSAPERGSSKPISTLVMMSRFHSSGLQQAAADENARVNNASSTFHPRHHDGKRPPASTSGVKTQRVSTGGFHPNHVNGSRGSSLAEQRHGRGSRVGIASPSSSSFAASTPAANSSTAGKRCAFAANPSSSCKRSRNRFVRQDFSPADSRGSRLSLSHGGVGEVDQYAVVSFSNSSALYGSSQISVVRDLIQTYPSHAPISSPPACYLPCPPPGQRHVETFHPTLTTVKEVDGASNAHPARSSSSPRPFHLVDAIRDAVRAYTRLPDHERSSDCGPVRTILDLTGYVLVSPFPSSAAAATVAASGAGTHGLLGSPGVTTRAHKADVLHKLGGDDVFHHLDACKIRDASAALQATQCRPEKDRGCYRYVHVPTGTLVSPYTYEARYLAALADACALQWQYWGRYFDRLKKHDEDVRKEKRDVALRLASARQRSTGMSSAAATNATPTARLLPLPSRDESSSDPDVAKAERELWDKIDAALEDYSHKVLVIQERRRGALQTNGYAV